MYQTLFRIPHSLAGIPVFGGGLLLTVWLLFCVATIVWMVRRADAKHEVTQFIVTGVLVALVIGWLLPRLEVVVDGKPAGLPIRGYGVMVLSGVLAGFALALRRARAAGIADEIIHSLAAWLFVGGIIGARSFFVIQYWDQFQADSWRDTVWNIARFTEGGLVVYGAFWGATVAFIWFIVRYRVSALPLADCIAPSLALGLALGRIGCFFNGCCYGGPSDNFWAVRFPPESPPYQQQLQSGELLGFALESSGSNKVVVARVASHSAAGKAGVRVGDQITHIGSLPVSSLAEAVALLSAGAQTITGIGQDGSQTVWPISPFPEWSLPVHPTQLYSAIGAALLCLLTIAISPFRRRDGEVIATLLTLYPLVRWLEEMIRTDEGAIFGTQMTISQIISLILLGCVVGLWAYIECRRDSGLAQGTSGGQPASNG